MEFLPCVCGTIQIIEELITVRSKMRVQDPSAMDDLLQLMKNYDSYSKKEKQLIRKTIAAFLEQNISIQNSKVELEDQKN